MPTRLTPRHSLPYFLLCIDKSGAERPEEDGSLLSERILDAVRATDPKVTDVFVMSHGWKGDVDSAIEQYDRWIDVMGDCTEDRARAREVRPGFTPLLVGFHWPSLPFGEEGTGGNAFDTAPGAGRMPSSISGPNVSPTHPGRGPPCEPFSPPPSTTSSPSG